MKEVIGEYDQFKTEAEDYNMMFPEEQAFLHHDNSMQFFDDDYQMQSENFNDQLHRFAQFTKADQALNKFMKLNKM